MKSASFEYHRPETVAEALALLTELGDEAKLLAGGQSLVPMLALRLAYFDHLIDIARLPELRGITVADGWLRVGAGETEAAVGRDAVVAGAVPLLTRATPLIGHFQIRNRGTLCGSVAHADPAGEYPTVALTLDAEMVAASASGGERTIAGADFFTGLWDTALEPDEMLVAVRFPVWSGRAGFAVEEFARRSGDFAIAGAAVAVELDGDDRVARAAIGLLGMASVPLRAPAAERAVVGQRVDTLDPAEVGVLAMSELDDVPADLQGSAAYRTRVGATMVTRAWTSAIKEATGLTAGAEGALHG
ncbi:xanthine dehydrogenase family protein subunit M [Frankia sp. AgB1.9]|uniref:FAD binding domain-containing protein n=1 Tax=unclassified Frankia TaxID=2632575 RepID=UPI0019346198|nr:MULTISPECIES: xanthine dehydrogenase family protein subunit M [unclassified Frankia]MBL7493351.1 xanthine dehydrogenase family protein subunit M [Frankia sp. AgW1.1]MBL7552896.1 xanthine dehydrogenase family protein subunit M [Frankia sp. AgB1.9]MBL7621077.1 xanthine dehydrogenase family protein subunit M [Frankia sp. AgB1.8]